MSMHTPEEWHHHAGDNMAKAQMTHRKASAQNKYSVRAHEETTSDNLSMYQQLQSSMKQKVQNSYRLIDMLQKRADSVRGSIQHSQHSLAQIEAAHRDKDPQMQHCLWRMEQRERRPLREQVRDNTEVTLESEKAVLQETQVRLSEARKRTKNMISELEGKLTEVLHDLDHKNQAVGVDETCLRTTQRSMQSIMDRVRPHSSPGFRTGVAMRTPRAGDASVRESSRNELARQQGAVRLNQAAATREEQARVLREECKAVIARCQKAAEDAAAKTERALQERVNEHQQMRRRLEGEIRSTNGHIDHTKSTISETRSQIKSLEEPMDLTTTCASFRKQRATREHITDPVSTKISEHQTMIIRAREELMGHHQSEKANLQDLNERKERLKDDMRDKTAALHIDLNCLTHESAHMNGKATTFLSKNKLSRAMKIDSRFVPSPSTNVHALTAR